MANYDHVLVKCQNTEVIDEIADRCFDDKVFRENPGEISITIRNGDPHIQLHEYLKSMSTQRTEEIIAEVSFEHDDFARIHIMRYLDGKEEQIGLKPHYSFEYHGSVRKKLGDELFHKIMNLAIELLCKVDSTQKDKDGNFELVYPPGELTYIFEHCGYRIEAIKYCNQITICVYERTGKWREMGEEEDWNNAKLPSEGELF